MKTRQIVIMFLLVLAAFFVRMAFARSQSQAGRKVEIIRVEPNFGGPQELRSSVGQRPVNGNILGFSCSSGPNSLTECYVLMDAE